MRRKARRRLDPRSYPRSVRDRVEMDYAQKLSPEERQWLAAFNEAEYGGNPGCLQFITGKYVPVAERRRLMREIKRYQRDLLSTGLWMDVEYFKTRVHGDRDGLEMEELLIHQIDNGAQIERVLMEILKQSILLKQWGKYGKA